MSRLLCPLDPKATDVSCQLLAAKLKNIVKRLSMAAAIYVWPGVIWPAHNLRVQISMTKLSQWDTLRFCQGVDSMNQPVNHKAIEQ
eukprot:scaffold6747_cov31-Prasinocladus_malaysianus.AAC.1